MPFDFMYDSSWPGISASVSLAYNGINSTWAQQLSWHTRTITLNSTWPETSWDTYQSVLVVPCDIHTLYTTLPPVHIRYTHTTMAAQCPPTDQWEVGPSLSLELPQRNKLDNVPSHPPPLAVHQWGVVSIQCLLQQGGTVYYCKWDFHAWALYPRKVEKAHNHIFIWHNHIDCWAILERR